MKIAFFDSGIGGLTVLKEAIRLLPFHDYIYYADTQNVPYGTKAKDEVRTFIFDAVNFISRLDVSALVLACNTATSVAVADLRSQYRFPIIGMEPAVKPAVVNNKGKNILVLATPLTLREAKLNTLISQLDQGHKIVKMEMGALVNFAEDFDFCSDSVRAYIHQKLSEIDITDFETLVLGCTHFIFFKDIIREFVGQDLDIIDGNIGTINNLKNKLPAPNPHHPEKGQVDFYSSGIKDGSERVHQLMKVMNGLK